MRNEDLAAIDPDRDLAADERLCEEATDGPWDLNPPGGQYADPGWCDEADCFKNQPFIASARTGWPDSLARLRALREGPLRGLLLAYRESIVDANAEKLLPVPKVVDGLDGQIHDIARALGVKDVEAWLRGE